MIDPITGKPLEHDRLVTARNDVLYLEDLPIFWWPVMATDLNEPSYYLRRIQFRQRQRFRHAGPHGLQHVPTVGAPQAAAGHRMGPRPRLPQHARLRTRQHVPVSREQPVRHSRPVGRIGRLSGASTTTATTTWASTAPTCSPRSITAIASSCNTASNCPTDSNSPSKAARSATATSSRNTSSGNGTS